MLNILYTHVCVIPEWIKTKDIFFYSYISHNCNYIIIATLQYK